MTKVDFIKKLIEIEFDVHTKEEIDKIFDKFYIVVSKEEYTPKHLKKGDK
jgi:hypothetical protein